MNLNPIIVIGLPRSGTSVVARLLQENLNIMMDEGPIRKDSLNPYGYYEDHKLVGINSRMLNRWKANDKNSKNVDRLWAIEFTAWIVSRSMKYKKWGFKDPRLVGFLPWVVQYFNNATWIVCDRKERQIIKSQVTKLGISLENAVAGIRAEKALIEKYVCDYNIIDMSHYYPENELIKYLDRVIYGDSKDR